MPTSEAQAEFDALMNGRGSSFGRLHPEDATASARRSASTSPNPQSLQQPRTLRNGRYNGRDSDDDEGDSDGAGQQVRLQSKSSKTRYYIPSAQRRANTGPKGVIADAQAFEQARRVHRSVISLSQHQHQHQHQPVGGIPAAAVVQPRGNSRAAQSILMDASDDDETNSSDDGFMARWRQTRLQELSRRQHGPDNYLGQQQRRQGPRYGKLAGVDADGYLDAVEMTKSDTIVCVYIYDDASEVSREIEDAVKDVARAYPSTRFVKLHYEEAQMDAMGVPALLAYRNGDKFADMVPIIDEIPMEDELSPETMATAMKRRGMLK